jgi:hypothetical protein
MAFIAMTDHGLDGGVDGLGAPAGHRDLGLGVHGAATGCGDLRGDALAQGEDAFHGRVLVEPGGDRVRDARGQSRIYRVVWEALSHIDRALQGGAARHHGEYRGAYVGQFALESLAETHLRPSEKPPRTPVRGAFVGRLLLLGAFRLSRELELNTGGLVDEAEADAFHHRLVLDRAGRPAQFFAARRAESLSFASCRIFFRSAGVQGALCLRADLAIYRILVK